MKKKLIRFVTLAIILLLLPTSNVLAKAKPRLSKTSITITKGKTYTLKVKNNKKKVKWSSKNKKIATVSSKGEVKGIKSGTTYVYTKIKSSKTLKCKVKVKNPITKPTSSSNTNNNFSISKIYSKLSMQQSQKLYAIFESGKSNETVKWESTNKEVATIDQSGLVKAKSIGTTIIIATYNNIQRICQVDVYFDKEKDTDYVKSKIIVNMKSNEKIFTVNATNNSGCRVRIVPAPVFESYNPNNSIDTYYSGFYVNPNNSFSFDEEIPEGCYLKSLTYNIYID